MMWGKTMNRKKSKTHDEFDDLDILPDDAKMLSWKALDVADQANENQRSI